MTYGLKVNSANNSIQIDSDQQLSYLKTVQTASAATVTTALTPALNLETDLIFAKPTTMGDTIYGSFSGGIFTFNVSVSYYILRPTKTNTASTSGYGLQVFNAVDGALAFDSEVFSGSGSTILQISKVCPQGTVSGNYGNVYTGSDYNTIYSCVNYSVANIPGGSFQDYRNNFQYNVASTSIKFKNYWYVAPFFGSGGYVYNTNWISLLLAKVVVA